MITKTIREQITEQIRDELMDGRFTVGQPLREADLAKRFGVSRGPIRDAFLQLSQEGFLAYEANRGVTVQTPPPDENRELIVSLRRQIECFVIVQGWRKLAGDEFHRIAAALSELHEACDAGRVAAVARCDIGLHQQILVTYGGASLLPVWKWLCSQMMLTYTRLDDYADVFEEHVRIVEAIQHGDQARAIEAIEANIK
ncbi:MAG: GntR family transcriptional regulator [Planctomycetales bacterium]|nr:GntR family transcriptional regulator [Planctomycetales bacterium]